VVPLAGVPGGVGNNRLSASLAIGVAEMPPMQYAVLNNAVQNVVGPHASPDMALIAYAANQGGPPRTVLQIFGYIPFLQNIARKVGLGPVPGDVQNHNGATNINDIIMQRSIRWMRTRGVMMAAGAVAV
jgi:hypothetical protein